MGPQPYQRNHRALGSRPRPTGDGQPGREEREKGREEKRVKPVWTAGWEEFRAGSAGLGWVQEGVRGQEMGWSQLLLLESLSLGLHEDYQANVTCGQAANSSPQMLGWVGLRTEGTPWEQAVPGGWGAVPGQPLGGPPRSGWGLGASCCAAREQDSTCPPRWGGGPGLGLVGASRTPDFWGVPDSRGGPRAGLGHVPSLLCVSQGSAGPSEMARGGLLRQGGLDIQVIVKWLVEQTEQASERRWLRAEAQALRRRGGQSTQPR